MRPSPTNPTARTGSSGTTRSVRLRRELPQHALGHPERLQGPRRAAVDRGLQEHLLDLLLGASVGDRAPDVHAQLVVAVQRREHREVEQAAGTPVQAGPAPDVAPGRARDVLLHGPGEVAHPGQRPVDVSLPEHLAPDRQGPLVPGVCRLGAGDAVVAGRIRVRHRCPSGASRARYSFSSTSSAQTVGPSDTARWVITVSSVPPCQWRSPGGTHTTSPARITSGGPPCEHTQPRPAVTTRIWPPVWWCQ